MKEACMILGVILIILLIIAFDLVLIPWVVMKVLSWFGVMLSLGQCIIIVMLFNILTYGFRKKD